MPPSLLPHSSTSQITELVFQSNDQDALFAFFVLFAVIGGGFLFLYGYKIGISFFDHDGIR